MGVVGRGIFGVERDWGGGEGRLERADPVGREGLAAAIGDRRGLQRLGQVEPALGAIVVDADQRGRGAGLLEGFGHDDRDGLVVVVDLGPAEQLGGVAVALAELAGIAGGDDRDHARRRLGLGDVDPADRALGDPCADDVAVGRVRDFRVLVGIGRPARDLQRSVDAILRATDHLHPVDRVGAGGGFELHGLKPSSGKRPAPSPRRGRGWRAAA